MSTPQTPQEQLWRGEFGSRYIDRNEASDAALAALTRHWARILDCMESEPPRQILEIGANIGRNLRALRRLTTAELLAVEPNADARARMEADGVLPPANVFDGVASRLPFADASVDMAFTSGVLIHIHPDDLAAACAEIHRVAARHIVCVEYFSDKAEEIPYRGHTGALFKRDFGSLWLDQFPDLKVVDYGFAWKRVTGLDNLTWWVFRKG